MSQEKIEREVWLVAIVIVLGTVGGLLSVTTVTVGLGRLANDLHSSLDTAQWTITGYILGLAAIVPATAWMARRVGVRRLYARSLPRWTR
jgi:MFS family permease